MEFFKTVLAILVFGVIFFVYFKYKENSEKKKEQIREVEDFFFRVERYVRNFRGNDEWYFDNTNVILTSKMKHHVLSSGLEYKLVETKEQFLVEEYDPVEDSRRLFVMLKKGMVWIVSWKDFMSRLRRLTFLRRLQFSQCL